MRPERGLGVEISRFLPTKSTDGALRLIIPACEWSVRCGLQTIQKGIQHLSLSDDDLSTIELVIAEILNNILKHAYKDITCGMIEVELRFIDECIMCVISDDGISMPSGEIPPGSPKDLTGGLETLPEGGFGWFLIRELTQDLHYHRDGTHNVLSCSINTSEI